MSPPAEGFVEPVRARGFYGRRVNSYRATGFRLAESTYDGRASLPLHAHARAHFCLVLSGSYTERLGGRELRRRPGDLIFYRAGLGHAEWHDAPGRHFLIEIDGALAATLRAPRGEGSWISRRGATRSLATRVFAEFRRARQGSAERVARLVERLVDEAVRRPAAATVPAWLRRVERRLRAGGPGAPDLERLAAEAGVHPVYLGRAFRAAFGCTPGEFSRLVRVERAQRALAGAEVELADVAYASGFCDQSHLNRVFKRHTGLTPGRYRRLACAPDYS